MANPLVDVAIERFAEHFAKAVSAAMFLARNEDCELAATTACEKELKPAAEELAEILAKLEPWIDQGKVADAIVVRSRTVLAERLAVFKSGPPRRSGQKDRR